MTNQSKLHTRNKHKNGYDFTILCETHTDLKEYVHTNKYDTQTIDFANNKAVLALNYALLKAYYNVTYWEIPQNSLCPPIPGRADYIHYLADLLKETNNGKIPHKQTIKALDIGTGANCIYPIIGASQYKWDFVGTDISVASLTSANSIIDHNEHLKNKIQVIHQTDKQQIFSGVIEPEHRYDITLCNPPFHRSAQEAASGTERKWKNLGIKSPDKTDEKNNLNFGGHHNELWCDGGELKFIKQMILESKRFRSQVLWFTCLVSKKEHLKALQLALKKAKSYDIKIIKMTQGQKVSRFIAWSFLNKDEKQQWCSDRFS